MSAMQPTRPFNHDASGLVHPRFLVRLGAEHTLIGRRVRLVLDGDRYDGQEGLITGIRPCTVDPDDRHYDIQILVGKRNSQHDAVHGFQIEGLLPEPAPRETS